MTGTKWAMHFALFDTSPAQTPRKAAQKKVSKVTNTNSFVNDIKGMYADGVAYPANIVTPYSHRKKT